METVQARPAKTSQSTDLLIFALTFSVCSGALLLVVAGDRREVDVIKYFANYSLQ